MNLTQIRRAGKAYVFYNHPSGRWIAYHPHMGTVSFDNWSDAIHYATVRLSPAGQAYWQSVR